MNFSKTNEDELPLWYLVWNKTKTVTRRVPPCLHCGCKPWEHGDYDICEEVIDGVLVEMKRPKGGCYTYEPDLSRWQPKQIEVYTHTNLNTGNPECPTIDFEYREISVCPGRGKAAICAFCGCWKEHHTGTTKSFDKYEMEAWEFITKHSNNHTKCSRENYTPLKVLIKSVMMDSEYCEMLIAKTQTKKTSTSPFLAMVGKQDGELSFLNDLKAEAHREGFKTWAGLQVALFGKGGYPEGTPLARIEFERID